MMKKKWRKDERGVSEVVGTILILAMTVVLFASIILWVSSIPTPAAQTRLDMFGQMEPIYNPLGVEVGVNITAVHQGGEALQPFRTVIYVTSQRGAISQTDAVLLHLYNGFLATPSGLLDGSNSVWDIGERWAYKNYAYRSTDTITITVVDTSKSTVVWNALMTPPPGTRPPVFVDKWADGILTTDAVDPVQATLGFYLFARVADPDNDLNPASVYATLTPWYGSGTPCQLPLQMRDDGAFPDRVANDGVFTLGGNFCTNRPYPALSWSGSIVLMNATDRQGHQTTTRFVLNVVPPTSGGGGNQQTIPSALWQYIGYIQIRTGEVWVSGLNDPYNTTATYQPYRVTAGTLNGNGGALFHFRMANHGNTTIFLDGWTAAVFTSASRAAVKPIYIAKPVNPIIPANAGGIGAYPGIATNPNDFQYAQAFDIDPTNQEKGGSPIVVLAAAQSPFRNDWPNNFRSETLFISLLVSGMAGPGNYTYSMLVGGGSNPLACTGLGPAYNPIRHLNDAIVACRSSWYAQVIPFIGMVVY